MSAWRVVCAKEFRETLRDRRTLLVMIVVPVLLYPVLLITMEQLLLFGIRNLEAEAAPVAVVRLDGEAPRAPAGSADEAPDVPGLDRDAGGPALEELEAIVDRTDGLRRVVIGDDPEAALRGDSVAAIAMVFRGTTDAGPSVVVLYDAASDLSNRGRGELTVAVEEWRDSLLAGRLDAAGLPRSFAEPIAVADSSIARPDEVGGYTLGRILPLLLVIMTLLGAFYPAIDLAAGEKERGTLEPLLTAPVPARDIVIGKFVTVAVIGIVAAGLNLVSMLLTFQTGILQVTAAIGLEVSISPLSVVAIFLTLIPLSVLFGALFLGIAVGASSFKEAQNALTPVYMLVIVPAMLPIFPGIDFGPLMAIAPVAGVAFLFRDLMTGSTDPVLGLLVVLSTSVYAILALAFAARAFGSERVLFGGGNEQAEVPAESWWMRARSGRGPVVPTPRTAVLFIAFAAVAFFWGGIPLQIMLGERGLLAAEWLLLFVPAILFVRFGGFEPRTTLSLKTPSLRQVAAAVLVIFGAMPLVWAVGWLQTFVLPVPWELLEGLEELVTAESAGRLLWLLLLLALTPAICEEVVFRGVLLGGTRVLEPWRMILLNGVVFGAFHLSFETIIRFLPTATLGMVIAWSVWRTGSIWIGMLMHALNNGTIVVLASIPTFQRLFSDPEAPPPLWLVPAGLVIFAAGVRTLRRVTSPAPSGSGPDGSDPISSSPTES